MTIHELLQAAGLTANDEIPIWDVDGTGEPTKKITAQQLAAAIVALANLVIGVKGNAESSFRTGNVNLTPANIGAFGLNSLASITDANDNTLFGVRFVNGANVANLPTATYLYELVCMGNLQLAIEYNGNYPSNLYKRYYVNSRWYSWNLIVSNVCGVKGNAEGSYRQGNVNLTPADIGALPDTTTAADIGAVAKSDIKSLRLEAGEPMDNGQVDLGLATNKIPISAWSTNTVCEFYVRGNTSTWWMRLSDRITGAVISGTTTPLPINVKYMDV